jgi:hypothetical protein
LPGSRFTHENTYAFKRFGRDTRDVYFLLTTAPWSVAAASWVDPTEIPSAPAMASAAQDPPALVCKAESISCMPWTIETVLADRGGGKLKTRSGFELHCVNVFLGKFYVSKVAALRPLSSVRVLLANARRRRGQVLVHNGVDLLRPPGSGLVRPFGRRYIVYVEQHTTLVALVASRSTVLAQPAVDLSSDAVVHIHHCPRPSFVTSLYVVKPLLVRLCTRFVPSGHPTGPPMDDCLGQA